MKLHQVHRILRNGMSFFAVSIGVALLPRTSVAVASCAPAPSGLISWWRAESNAVDSVDGNHGTLAGNASYGAGRVGNGFVLDGNRDGVLVGTATNLRLQDFSIEGWIKRTSAATISFNGNGGAEIFALGAGGGGFGFYLRPDARLALGKLQVNEATATVSITDTNWHHVAVTKTNTTVVFYVDGLAYPAAAYSSGGFTYSGPGYIGAWRNPSGLVDNSFYGAIDELGFYGRALSAGEINSIFTAGGAGKCPSANQPPQAHPQSVSLFEDAQVNIILTGTDPDGDPLTYLIVNGPTNGTLSGSAPNPVYTPAPDYFGPDSFAFTVADAVSTSAVVTVSITVRPVNDPPIARIEVSPLTQVLGITNQVVIAAVCGDATVILDGSSSSDVENDPLTYEWTEGTNSLGSTAIVTNQFAVGTHEIRLRVNDGALDGTANKIVEVVSAAQSLGIIIAYIEDSDLGRRNGRPLIAALKAAAASFDNCRTIPGVNQLEAFQHMVRAQLAPLDADLAARLIQAAQQIIDAVQASPSE